MRLIRHFDEVTEAIKGGVLALGNFDGVHLGHQAVIGEAQRKAAHLKVPAGVMSFEPHPRQVFQPDAPPFRLSPLRTKSQIMQALGVDFFYVQHFDQAFSERSAQSFMDDVLLDGLDVRHVVVGYDYVFGHNRTGNAVTLTAHMTGLGRGVTVVEEVKAGSDTYKSTQIRDALAAGDCAASAAQLGRYWEIAGRVEEGDQRGRTIGFPTANVPLGEYLRPRTGVYSVLVGVDEEAGLTWRGGVANLGTRPTFDGKSVLLEVHLFDFQGDLYGQNLRVALLDHIRDEQKFDGIDSLKAQIEKDSETARDFLSAVSIPAPGAAFVPAPNA